MLDYTKIENRLKSFLKNNKKIGYSVALLVSFLINGGFSYAEEVVATRLELQDKIVQEQDNISQMIKDTDKNVSDIELKIKKLTQRGEFWVKPLERSTQVFLLTSFGNYTRNRNRTKENFTEPEYKRVSKVSGSSKNVYEVNSNGISVLAGGEVEKPSYKGSTEYDGINYGEYGIIKNPLEFVDKVDFGANLTPKLVTEKKVPIPTVKQTSVTKPSVSVSSINVSAVSVAEPQAPTSATITSPAAPSISVVPPGNITPLGAITVATVAPVTVTVAQPATVSSPTVKAPTVAQPATPEGFSPKLITPPVAPNQPEAPVLTPPTLAVNVGSDGNSESNVIIGNGSNGRIQSVAVADGDFKIVRTGSSSWTYTYSGYKGSNVFAVGTASSEVSGLSAAADGTWGGATGISGSGSGAGLGFQTLVGKWQNSNAPDAGFLNNGNFLYTRAHENPTDLLGEFVHQDVHGAEPIATQRTRFQKAITLATGTSLATRGTAILAAYDDAMTSGSLNISHTWVNSGKIVIEGGNTSLTNTYTHFGTPSKQVSINTGEVIFQPYRTTGGQEYKKYTAVFVISNDTNAQTENIKYNGPTGKIKNYTMNAVGFVIDPASNRKVYMVNRGDFEFYGESSAGIYVKRLSDINLQTVTKGFAFNAATNKVTGGSFKPIKIFGDKSIGYYNIPSNGNSTTTGNFAVDIGAAGKGNQTFSTAAVSNTTAGKAITDMNINPSGGNSGKNTNIEGSFGILSNIGINLTSHQIRIYDKTEKNVGVFPNANVLLNIGGGNIELNGGTGKTSKDNIGIYVDGKGAVKSTGDISVTGGVGNLAIFAVGGALPTGVTNQVEVGEVKGTNTKNSVLVYGSDGAKINITKGMTVTGAGVEADATVANKKDTGAVFAEGKGTEITINRTALPVNENISITGTEQKDSSNKGTGRYVGFGLMAKDGGKINAKFNNIKVQNGSTGVAAIGKDSSNNASNIDLTGSKLTYDGNGYAVYSDGVGKVNLSDAELNLEGSSTAFDVDLKATTLPITLNANTRIHANSADVVAFNLKNATGLTTAGGIESSIKAQIETKLSLGKNSLDNLFKGSTSTGYKVAAVDGGEITIGNLDKSGKEGDTAQDKIDGYQYFNRFLAQRLKATATGKTIKAILTTADAAARYNKQVVGFEMNSSKNANNNTEAAINLVNSKIIADRNGAGTGAIGAFINYGKVNIDNKSSVEVETQTGNAANDKAVGVYSVNGSEVSNKGTVKVGGNQSVGILGMAYRLDNKNNLVIDEFGSKAKNQGLVTITNEKDIIMTGRNAIGIYATNNNKVTTVNKHTVINKGNITVGKTEGSTATAVGIYADKVTVKPEGGTIKIGEGAVGIYATPTTVVGEGGKNLGTIHFNGNKGVGIYLKGTTSANSSKLNGNKLTLKNDNNTNFTQKIGIMYDLDSSVNPTSVTEIDASAANNTIAYYTLRKDLTVKANVKLGEGSTGLAGASGSSLTYGDNSTPFTMNVGKKSTGLYGDKNITLGSKSTINLKDEGSTAAYATGASGVINANGKIAFEKEKSIGLYAANGAKINEGAGTNYSLDFSGTNAKNNTGIYLQGAEWIGTTNAAGTTFNSAHAKRNVYLYAQGSKVGSSLLGSKITLKKKFLVDGGTGTGGKTTAFYLDTTVKGGTNKYAENILDMEGPITVKNKSIGIYAKNNSSTVDNTIKRSKVISDGKEAVGIYANGNLKLDQLGYTGVIKAENKGIGLYGNNKAKITNSGSTNVEITNGGTGIYLTNGSYLTGGNATDVLVMRNNTAGTAAAGVYYTKGSYNSQLTHNVKITVNNSKNLLAMYLDGGVSVKNASKINIDTINGNDDVGVFVTGGSKFENGDEIEVGSTSSTQKKGLGVYVQHGEATNNANKLIKVQDNNTSANSLSVAMAAAGSTSAKITNAGKIEAIGSAIGMNISGRSEGSNTSTGTITTTDTSSAKAIGVYVNGANAKFTNAGTISSQNIALALKDTVAGKIANTGVINLTKNNAVGVYANNSVVDFNVAPTTNKAGTVALYATGNTKINSKITSASGAGHIGAYLATNGVTFGTSSSVVVNNGSGTNFGMGIYTKGGYTGTINTTITQNGKETIGIYAGNDGGTGSTINHQGTINIGEGIGIYVPQHSKFVAQNSTLNINKGVGVYLKGGTVDLGNTGKAKINFGANGGTAIYQESGNIITGSNLTITGKGSFLALKNANSSINSLVGVGENGIGINATYDAGGMGNYVLDIGANGKLQLNGNSAVGISATANGLAPNKVTVTNKGTVETVGTNTETTGIIAKGASVVNDTTGKINIGNNGTAIYTTNDGTDKNSQIVNNGEINLNADKAKGIVGIKANTNQDVIVGKIKGTKNELVGAFFKNSNTIKVKNAKINLGTNAKGLVFDNTTFDVTSTSGKNEIKVGRTTDNAKRAIGVAAIGSNGTISNTNITVGSTSASGSANNVKQSMGLYAQNGTLTYDSTTGELKSVGGNTILAYADTGSIINYNGGRTLQVGFNSIGVGAKGGTVNANTATQIAVNGANGIGAYVNGGSINSNFDIKVKSAQGRGVYATGNTTSLPKVSEIKGNNSIGYVLENVTKDITIPGTIALTEASSTGQFGVVAMGTGKGLTVSGVSVAGGKNIGISSTTGGAVTNTGTLSVGNSTSSKNSAIGIYSQGGAITSSGAVTVGNNSIGVYGEKTSVTTGAMTVGDKGVGISLANTAAGQGNATVNGNVSVGNGAVGIQASNAAVSVANLSVGNGNAKGIYATGAGNVTATGNLSAGDKSVAIFKNGTGTVNVGTTGLGNTTKVGNDAYGIISQGSNVVNNTNITAGINSVGAYVENANLASTGSVNVGDKGVGLFLKGGAGNTLSSNGALNIGSNSSVGLYTEGANISQIGAMNIAANNGIGVYSKGTGSVATNGNITVGNDSIGVYKSGSGTMNIGTTGQTLSVGDKGYGIYYLGGTSSNSTINSNMNMALGKEGVGIYGKNTTITQKGNITVGETTIGPNGYSNPNVNKNSIGVFGDNSNITYTGTMNVNHPLSVGIYGMNGGNIKLQNATLNVSNGATGIMTGKGVNSITVDNKSVINVDGKATSPDASSANVSFGIAAYSGIIENKGKIKVSNGATGIYVAGTANLVNNGGTIEIDPTGGKRTGSPDTKASANIGGITVTNKGEVRIGDRVINGGVVKIRGDVTMAGLGLDFSTGKTIIDARSISGVATVLPNFSQGNSVQKFTIQNVFRTPREGGIGAFSGDIKSQSVSWIAKISSPSSTPSGYTRDITMARIPYPSLIGGTRYDNLSKGMEEVRQNINANKTSEIFKSFDQISSHKKFGEAVADVRGDVYSNMQERMKTVESAFEKSYDELLDSYNKTRNTNKFSVIHTRGEHKDSTLGVAGYSYNSSGALYVNDREGFTYGGKYGWSAGVIGTNFKFNGDTNKGSKERVISGKLGLHYQTPLNKNDDNARLKWLTRGEITLNSHRTKRHSLINTETYVNKAHFYSMELSWKNRIFYDHDISTNWTVKPYVGIDMSYGHIFGIKETGNELNLEVKGKNYYEVTPNIGVETKYVLPVGLTHQMFVKADAELSYDVSKLYHSTNMAKIKDASTGYYKLSEPERRRARVAVGAELGFEKENTYGVTFRAEYRGYKKSDLNYGVRLNYKF